MLKEIINKLKGKKPVRAYRSGWLNQNQQFDPASYITLSDSVIHTISTGEPTKESKKEDTRIKKLPVEVYTEIFTKQPEIDCLSLDNKIALVEKRIRVLKEVGCNLNNENEALGFLQARKKYMKCKDLFAWETTSDELIAKLCKDYKVKMVEFSSYARNIPAEAIDELEKFNDAYIKVRADMPILKLIIDDTKESKERRKDPILLASSPFGAWWYVLGAWDKEVEIVDDLIYKKK